MKRLEFINVTGPDVAAGLGDTLGVDESSRRRIRVQVMKDFWSKERKQQRKSSACNESTRTQPLLAVPEPRIPLALYVPEVWRSLFASFLLQDHYYTSPHPSLMSSNVQTYFSHGRAPVTAILDCLIILHVGSTSRDEGLLFEARKRYVFAITSLRLDTTRNEPEISVAGLLMVAMGILLSEIYSSASQGLNTSSWQCQIVGVSALVRARHGSHQDSGVERHLLQWLKLLQLLHALCNRKPFPKDIAITTAAVSRSPSLTSLLRIASGVAPLLEAVDSAMTLLPREADLTFLFKRLLALESELNSWLKEHLQQPTTENDVEQTSPSRHNRNTVFDLTCESLCRICLLLVVESLNDLSKHNYPRASSQHNGTHQTHHQKSALAMIPTTTPPLEVHTAQLCRTATLLASAAQTPINKARAVSGPIHFLQEFFARKGDEASLQWCAELKAKVCKAVPYLRWDALLPWCLLGFHEMFVRD